MNIYLEVGSAALRLKVASLLEVAPAWNRREVGIRSGSEGSRACVGFLLVFIIYVSTKSVNT